MMSESKNSSTAVDLSGLVQKPSTAPQKELLATVAGRLGQASVSSLIRHAIELSQIEKGWKNATGVKENKPNPENVTDAQAIRIVKAFGGEPSTKEIVDSKMSYDTAYAVVGQIISADTLAKESEADVDYNEARASFDEAFNATSAPAEAESTDDNE